MKIRDLFENHTILFLLLAAFIAFLCCLGLSSCTTDTPRMTKINGSTCVQTDTRFLRMKVHTNTEYIKTKIQQLEDLEVDKQKREQELDLKTEERQSAAAFYIGLALLIAAPGCVLIGGIINKGWTFWGTMAVLCGLLGVSFWTFEHLVPHLKWGVFGLVGAVVLWIMWKLKDFSLLERLKNSDPGKLL